MDFCIIIYRGDNLTMFALEFPIHSKFSLTPLLHKTKSRYFLSWKDSGVSWWLLLLLKPIIILLDCEASKDKDGCECIWLS